MVSSAPALKAARDGGVPAASIQSPQAGSVAGNKNDFALPGQEMMRNSSTQYIFIAGHFLTSVSNCFPNMYVGVQPCTRSQVACI